MVLLTLLKIFLFDFLFLLMITLLTLLHFPLHLHVNQNTPMQGTTLWRVKATLSKKKSPIFLTHFFTGLSFLLSNSLFTTTSSSDFINLNDWIVIQYHSSLSTFNTTGFGFCIVRFSFLGSVSGILTQYHSSLSTFNTTGLGVLYRKVFLPRIC